MLEFPRLVYRGPASHQLVQDMAEYDAALACGWNGCASEPVRMAIELESLQGETAKEVREWMRQKDVAVGLLPAAADPADNAPPTRDEMLAQAQKLGIDVDKRWGDKRLMAEINKAMGAGDAT
jgi:hypothetical protein